MNELTDLEKAVAAYLHSQFHGANTLGDKALADLIARSTRAAEAAIRQNALAYGVYQKISY